MDNRLVRTYREHPRSAGIFLLWWLAVSVITLATWQFEPDGTPLGMHPLATFLSFSVPFIAGGLFGRWASSTGSGCRRGMIAGLLAMEVNLVGQTALWMLVYRLILGRPLADAGSLIDALAEFFEFVLMSGVLGLLLGLVGALVFLLFASLLRRT